MTFPEELLALAAEFTRYAPLNQAVLRRSVSTSYYSLFHLLIDEAVSRWAVERQRAALARAFEHASMKKICGEILKSSRAAGSVPGELSQVAEVFVQLQDLRHAADYDNAKAWTKDEVADVVRRTNNAFSAWRRIRGHVEAEDFILQLFLPKLPKR